MANADTPQPAPPRVPFPFVRLIFAVAFGAIAVVVVQVIFLIALVQFVLFAVQGKPNQDLKIFLAGLVQYVGELLAFVGFVRDDQPFPMGPFPTPRSQAP